MPLNLDAPISRTAISSFKIKEIIINIEDQIMNIFYNKFAGEENVGVDSITIKGVEFLEIVNAFPDNTVNFYDNIKNNLYAHISEKLEITGTIV